MINTTTGFTAQNLFDLALAFEAKGEMSQSREALLCAAFVEKAGKPLRHVGPFSVDFPEENGYMALMGPSSRTPVRQGTRVVIPKGTKVSSTHPKNRGETIRGNSTTVAVHISNYGYTSFGDVCQGQVTWVGAGNYWFWCDLNDVKSV